MTVVNNSLRNIALAAGLKSGSKSSGDGGAAVFGAAFEDAISDAGKQTTKGKPVEADVTGAQKQTTDAKLVEPDVADAAKIADDEMPKATPSDGKDRSGPFRLSLVDDGEQVDQLQKPEPHARPRPDFHKATTSNAEMADNAPHSDPEADIDGEATGRTPPLKAGKQTVMKPAKASTVEDGAEPVAKDVSSVPASSAGKNEIDVNQLLVLLGAAQAKPAMAENADGEAAPLISEFHSLADRAGKTKGAATTEHRPAAADDKATDATETESDGSTDRIFRFARADGKGSAVSMSVGTDGEKAAAKTDAPTVAVNAKIESVTVVESRRYLGLAANSNAAVLTNAIASDPDWSGNLQPSTAALLTPAADAATGKVLNTLKIQMRPIDLGMVTATLRLKDDELHVDLKVETGEAFRQLSDDQNAMVKALRAQGFAVDQVSITFNASDSTGNNSSGQQQAQSQTGQQSRETMSDGAAQGRGRRNENGNQGQTGERWTGNDGTSAASSGLELQRAGDVYM